MSEPPPSELEQMMAEFQQKCPIVDTMGASIKSASSRAERNASVDQLVEFTHKKDMESKFAKMAVAVAEGKTRERELELKNKELQYGKDVDKRDSEKDATEKAAANAIAFRTAEETRKRNDQERDRVQKKLEAKIRITTQRPRGTRSAPVHLYSKIDKQSKQGRRLTHDNAVKLCNHWDNTDKALAVASGYVIAAARSTYKSISYSAEPRIRGECASIDANYTAAFNVLTKEAEDDMRLYNVGLPVEDRLKKHGMLQYKKELLNAKYATAMIRCAIPVLAKRKQQEEEGAETEEEEVAQTEEAAEMVD